VETFQDAHNGGLSDVRVLVLETSFYSLKSIFYELWDTQRGHAADCQAPNGGVGVLAVVEEGLDDEECDLSVLTSGSPEVEIEHFFEWEVGFAESYTLCGGDEGGRHVYALRHVSDQLLEAFSF